ncbi:MAG TPA: hypothetical protein VJQ46_02360 [Gemmatimonadales bacterium]|nr:hypothetical protein [Gemmatimonadales bacterium]
MTSRLRAWLLLVLFLSAGTSLPSADALLNHRRPESFRVHFDPAGGCAAHADHCTLGRTPPGSRAAVPVAFAARLAFHDRAPQTSIPTPRPLDARISLLPPSRAPPAPLS